MPDAKKFDQAEGYARESEALKQFLARQQKAKAKRRARLDGRIYKDDGLTTLYTKAERKQRQTRARRAPKPRPAWNGSTIQEKKIKTRKTPAKTRVTKRKTYALAQNMDSITLNDVEVGESFRPEIKAALAGFKARLNSRVQHPTTKRLLEQMDAADPEERKRAEIEVAPAPNATMPQYARDAEHQWLYRIKLARKQREEERLAKQLRAPNEWANYKKTQEKRRKKRGGRAKPAWNASVSQPAQKRGVKNSVLEPEDHYTHRPTVTGGQIKKYDLPLDARDLAAEVAQRVQEDEAKPQRMRSPPRKGKDVPDAIRRGSYWGAFLKDEEVEDPEKKPMYPVVPADIPKLVAQLVKEAEDIEAKEDLSQETFLDNAEADHTLIAGKQETEWMKGTYFGYSKKMAEVHSADPVAEEISEPVRRSFRESFVPKDSLGHEIRQINNDYANFHIMGRTWRERTEWEEEEERTRRVELQSQGMGLAEAGQTAVRRKNFLNIRQKSAEDEFAQRMALARTQRAIKEGKRPEDAEILHDHHHHQHVGGHYMDDTEASHAHESKKWNHHSVGHLGLDGPTHGSF